MQHTATNPSKDAEAFIALYFNIKNIKLSHVLSYTIKPVIYGSLAAKLACVPNRFALITGLGNTSVKSEQELAVAMERFISNQILILKMSKKSRKLAEKSLT
ncbi:hypothetical protein [Psychrobacter sp. FDAARGOS_221]|uniref:hypothetical protein n=1 Tax=Psychrobacter sp. FDAARGOS_221 TaxID=1975705 RepID=UPI000BB540BA|nr:hypothetical protein [Psychrobacter sp. FDAARGOS_221]PNK61168.1 hypothetical protein A6J60_010005 [Psychrobacter sp. FDAARGOS_221]